MLPCSEFCHAKHAKKKYANEPTRDHGAKNTLYDESDITSVHFEVCKIMVHDYGAANVIYFFHYTADPPPQALKVVGMASELAHKAEFWRERPILV